MKKGFFKHMENTFTALKGDANTQWFAFYDSKLHGPMGIQDLALLVREKKLSVGSYVRSLEESSWSRIYERTEFQVLLPSAPPSKVMKKVEKICKETKQKKPETPAPSLKEFQRIWYLHKNDVQYGPFSQSELQVMDRAGSLSEESYFWKKGMEDWMEASAIPELNLSLEKSNFRQKEKRKALRKPFAVKVIYTNGEEVGWALCRDISIGGMQVLIENMPGEVGTKVKVNVSASSDIPAFTCDGEIVRILEDKRGFSFRFLSLSNEIQTAIKNYIA